MESTVKTAARRRRRPGHAMCVSTGLRRAGRGRPPEGLAWALANEIHVRERKLRRRQPPAPPGPGPALDPFFQAQASTEHVPSFSATPWRGPAGGPCAPRRGGCARTARGTPTRAAPGACRGSGCPRPPGAFRAAPGRAPRCGRCRGRPAPGPGAGLCARPGPVAAGHCLPAGVFRAKRLPARLQALDRRHAGRLPAPRDRGGRAEKYDPKRPPALIQKAPKAIH